MYKRQAKYGYKSGVLPLTRSILKNPTTKQQSIIAKVKAPKPKGIEGVGYAPGVLHPNGSHRHPPLVKFIDVEQLIEKTVAAPKTVPKMNSPEQEARAKRSQLRREFLTKAFKNEEQRLLRREELLKEKEKILELEKTERENKLLKEKSSDLTIPTLENILEQPLIRWRTPEERKILQLKRKFNRDLLEFQTKERKMEKLLNLYHIADEFIVTEKKLLQKIDEIFDDKYIHGHSRILESEKSIEKRILENDIGDAIFGTLGGGNYVGMPMVNEFLNGETKQFNDKVDEKIREKIQRDQQDTQTIQQH